MKCVKLVELNTKIVSLALNKYKLKIILYYPNVYTLAGITKKKKDLMKRYRNNLLIDTNFVTILLINSFCYCKKVLFHTYTLTAYEYMIVKTSMKHHYLRKEIFTVT